MYVLGALSGLLLLKRIPTVQSVPDRPKARRLSPYSGKRKQGEPMTAQSHNAPSVPIPDHLDHLRISDVFSKPEHVADEIETSEHVRIGRHLIEAMSLAFVAGHTAGMQTVNFRAGGAVAGAGHCAAVTIDGQAYHVRIGALPLNSFEAVDLAYALLAGADAVRRIARISQPGIVV